MRAAILVTGDEILRGRIEERNAGLIARSLEPLGVEVERVAIVGDDLDGLVRALEALLAGPADLICTTGGSGRRTTTSPWRPSPAPPGAGS